MPLGEASMIGKGVKSDREQVVESTNRGLVGTDFNPSEMLVQVLRRPSDPICSKLEQCLHQWTAAGIAYQPLKDGFGGWGIDVSRNWQLKLFRDSARKFKWLLMVDADVGPPVDAPMLLARHDKPVVSGVVPSYNNDRGLFLCVAVRGADGRAFFPTAEGTKTVPAFGLTEVHNAGTGCLLIRRDVVDALFERYQDERRMIGLATEADSILLDCYYSGNKAELTAEHKDALRHRARRFDFENDLSGAPFTLPQSVRDKAFEIGNVPKGEDIMFTDRVRAAGFSVYADFAVRCTHEKNLALSWPTKNIDPELDMDDWKVSAFDLPVVT